MLPDPYKDNFKVQHIHLLTRKFSEDNLLLSKKYNFLIAPLFKACSIHDDLMKRVSVTSTLCAKQKNL